MRARPTLCRPALGLTLLLLAGCGGRAPDVVETGGVEVTVALARIDELRDVAQASGTVASSTLADLVVHASETAEIAELPKQEGDTVAAGDVLVRFDLPAFEQELAGRQLELLDAESRFDRAQTELTRQTSLFERGIIARNTYDESRREFAAAESALAAAKNRLESVRSGQARTLVRATFPGVVASVWHAEGDLVRPDSTDPILRVVDPTRVQVSVQLPLLQLARVVVGQPATVEAAGAVAPEEAVVASKAQVVDPAAATGEIRLNLVAPSALPLDTPVSVEIVLERRTDVLIVPSRAVGRDDFGPYVMVAGPDAVARRRDVQLGLVAGAQTQVTQGLDEGERVIVRGLEGLEDGTPVVVR